MAIGCRDQRQVRVVQTCCEQMRKMRYCEKHDSESDVTGADSFRRLRVHAVDAGIDMRDMDVIYENGGHEDIQVRSTIQRGESTRPLDLQGGSRRLERVEFSYRSLPNMRGRKAKMVLEGQK